MFLVTVYPLTKTRAPFTDGGLSYFSRELVPRGAVIPITLNRKTIHAAVARTVPVRDAKTRIKKNAFLLKPITRSAWSLMLDESFVALAEEAGSYFFSSPGAVLAFLLPASILTSPKKEGDRPAPTENETNHTHTLTFLEGAFDHRKNAYHDMMKKTRGSVAIITPTIAYAEALAETFPRATLLHSRLSKKMLRTRWEEARHATSHIVIGTPGALSALPKDTALFIFENATSPHVRHPHAPHINTRTLTRMYARMRNIPLVEGMTSLLPEEAFAIERNAAAIQTLASPRASVTVIDVMRKQQERNAYPILSEPLRDALRKNSGRAIVFLNRRGLAMLTMCRDCGETARCNSCSAPLTLHEEHDIRVFICHRCKKRVDAKTPCVSCGGWDFKAYGMGTEEIESALAEHLPERPRFRIDADATPTEKIRKKIAQNFMGSRNGILIGTEMFLEEPELSAPLSAIASVDHLFTIPDARISGDIWRIINELKSRSETLFIQTRFADYPIFTHAASRTPSVFLDEELAERKALRIPPFALLVKLESSHKNERALALRARDASRALAHVGVPHESASAFILKERGVWKWRIIIRTTPTLWLTRSEKLRGALTELSQHWDIAVDPATTL